MANWDDPKSNPLEDIQRAKEMIAKDIGFRIDPWAVHCCKCGCPFVVSPLKRNYKCPYCEEEHNRGAEILQDFKY